MWEMTVQSLTAQLNETFATRIPVSKIAEKLKAYGLWDILVTDSFDEYIDNLIVSTDTDIDVDDLLQEEFFKRSSEVLMTKDEWYRQLFERLDNDINNWIHHYAYNFAVGSSITVIVFI